MIPVLGGDDRRAAVASVLRSRRLVPSRRVLAAVVMLVALAHAMSTRARSVPDEASPAPASVPAASDRDRDPWLVAANW